MAKGLHLKGVENQTLFVLQQGKLYSASRNTRHPPKAGVMLVRRLRRWPNIKPALGGSLVFAERAEGAPGVTSTKNSQVIV